MLDRFLTIACFVLLFLVTVGVSYQATNLMADGPKPVIITNK